jgi:hypothetical protein
VRVAVVVPPSGCLYRSRTCVGSRWTRTSSRKPRALSLTLTACVLPAGIEKLRLPSLTDPVSASVPRQWACAPQRSFTAATRADVTATDR